MAYTYAEAIQIIIELHFAWDLNSFFGGPREPELYLLMLAFQALAVNVTTFGEAVAQGAAMGDLMWDIGRRQGTVLRRVYEALDNIILSILVPPPGVGLLLSRVEFEVLSRLYDVLEQHDTAGDMDDLVSEEENSEDDADEEDEANEEDE
ncbi:uncharacterized protein LY89DRAFT_735192 [Mollisia scopiformis]|uniref:Uncharacterized protein n=1 Tax=Mollisia scopiformis TaxID=149040 RepID=A0A194X799_MOLSC|nr:uncharacterized protein LY89DRAFT_735192 [Mollisia scopiformis]KUJ16050.1 hypothetical protein LY89DRAFT_735192 [Mollisia scopiformis]